MCLMAPIQWSGAAELVFIMEWFHSCLIMMGRTWIEELTMVGSTDFVVARNGGNSRYKQWCSSGLNHLSGQPEKSFLLVVYEGGDR